MVNVFKLILLFIKLLWTRFEENILKEFLNNTKKSMLNYLSEITVMQARSGVSLLLKQKTCMKMITFKLYIDVGVRIPIARYLGWSFWLKSIVIY